MQRLQFSISWLQIAEASFTSVLEAVVKIFLPPSHYSNPLYYQILEKFPTLPPTPTPSNYSKPPEPDYSVL